MLTRRQGGSLCALASAVLALTVLAAPAAAQPIPLKVNECDSSIAIMAPANTMPGATIGVTLTHRVTMSRDDMGGPINQRLDQIDYVPDCAALGMGGGCMTLGTGTATVNTASVGGTCNMGAITPTDNMDGSYSFNFGTPSTAVLPEGASCTVTFDVDIAPAAAAPQTLAMTSSTAAICLNPLDPDFPNIPAGGGLFQGGDANSTPVDILPAMPSLGDAGLVLLALVLLAGAFHILRRRPRTSLPI